MPACGAFKITRTPLEGVVLIEPPRFADERGSFSPYYRRDEFLAAGIIEDFVQFNQSSSRRGVIRGLHYQLHPHAQAKLIKVSKGRIFDAVVDLRRSSPTFGRSFTVSLNSESSQMLYVPRGFAHGFAALDEDAQVIYAASDYYAASYEFGIAWNDPDLGIHWPSEFKSPSLSPKDAQHPRLKDVPAERLFE